MKGRIVLLMIITGVILVGLAGAAGWQNHNRANQDGNAATCSGTCVCPNCDGTGTCPMAGACIQKGPTGCSGQGNGWCRQRGQDNDGQGVGSGMCRQMRLRNGAGMHCPAQPQ